MPNYFSIKTLIISRKAESFISNNLDLLEYNIHSTHIGRGYLYIYINILYTSGIYNNMYIL